MYDEGQRMIGAWAVLSWTMQWNYAGFLQEFVNFTNHLKHFSDDW